MAKQGMKRPDYTHLHPKNDLPPVPEIQGKAKHTKEKANSFSGNAQSTSKNGNWESKRLRVGEAFLTI